MKALLSVLLALSALTLPLRAATPDKSGAPKEPKSPAALAEAAAAQSTVTYSQRYRAGEFDVSGYASADLRSFSSADAEYGVGFGLDYFLTRGFGIGVRAQSQDESDGFIDQIGPRLTVRAPLWDRVAPYGYTQALFDTEQDRWHIGTGAGIEWRFSKHFGAFAEGGVDLDLDGRSLLRTGAGLRLSF